MANNLEQQVQARLDGSVVNTEPFPFLYVEDIFPKNYYYKVDSIFPSKDQMSIIDGKEYKVLDTPLKERMTLTMFNRGILYSELDNYPHKNKCIQMRQWLTNFLVPKVAAKLGIEMPDVWDDDTRFVVDLPGYVKRPHTDIPQKIFSILIYMSESKSGTTILKPKQQGFRDDYGYDHRFDEFEEVFDPPFKPNCLMAFPRTDTSFHCVKKIGRGEYRKAIHINVRK